jgi:hypothetical protein
MSGRVEDVLAAHIFTLYPGEIACDCEWTNRDDVTREGDRKMIAAHVAHVAAALAEAGIGSLAQARAEALNEAADEMDRAQRVAKTKWRDVSAGDAAFWSASPLSDDALFDARPLLADWLRARAAAQQAATRGQGEGVGR